MLIVTSDALEGADPCERAAPWEGPRVLVALPGSHWTQARLQALEADFIVVECLQQPPSASWLLSEVMTRLRHATGQGEWPLVFIAGAIDPADLAGMARRGAEEPWGIEPHFRDDGTLDRLLLGESIATHPLAPTFFECLRGKTIEDSAFVELLGKNLAWGN